jgi:hypothetical protein
MCKNEVVEIKVGWDLVLVLVPLCGTGQDRTRQKSLAEASDKYEGTKVRRYEGT